MRGTGRRGGAPARPSDVASRAVFIAHQRRRGRHTRWLRRALRLAGRTLVGVSLVAALGVTAVVLRHWLRTTPHLQVRVVEVEGASRLDPAEIRAAAAVTPGTSLLALDVAAVEDRVTALSGVRQVRVIRHLPGRVTLLVEEREPYALVSAGSLRWVDAEGHFVGPGGRPTAPALPVLSGVEAPDEGPDRVPSERLRSGLVLLRALQRTGGRMAGRVSEIDLRPPGGPVLYLLDGVEVRLGDDGWSERLARLDGVLGELEARHERVAAVDLRFRDLVVLTPWPEAVPPSDPARRRPAGASSSPGPPAPERR